MRCVIICLGKGPIPCLRRGYDGAVIFTGAGLDEIGTDEKETIWAGCGAPLAKLCRTAAQSGLSGLEFAYGIPGSVGGAVYMNAGAYGGEMKDVLCKVRSMTQEGEIVTLPADSAWTWVPYFAI